MRSDDIRRALVSDFPELLSDEITLEKEVYAHFGRLYYAFSLVEHSMMNIVTFDSIYRDLRAGKITTKIDWEKGIDAHFLSATKMTFGNLVDKIKGIKEFSDIENEMKEIKRIRNYISHHFFRDDIILFQSDRGCWLLLERMYVAHASVAGLEEQLKIRTENLYSRIGLPYPKADFVASIIEHETAKAEALLREGAAHVGWETGDMKS